MTALLLLGSASPGCAESSSDEPSRGARAGDGGSAGSGGERVATGGVGASVSGAGAAAASAGSAGDAPTLGGAAGAAGPGVPSGPGGAAGETGLGPDECPIVDGECPAGCSPVEGSRVNVAEQCREPSKLFACDRFSGSQGDFVACAMSVTDGTMYVIPSIRLTGPGYTSWRPCEDSEVYGLPPCE